jgi:hypothetical protein
MIAICSLSQCLRPSIGDCILLFGILDNKSSSGLWVAHDEE